MTPNEDHGLLLAPIHPLYNNRARKNGQKIQLEYLFRKLELVIFYSSDLNKGICNKQPCN